MSVTIKIAELSGVSRGTVDRVLNNRGKVRADTGAGPPGGTTIRLFTGIWQERPSRSEEIAAFRRASAVGGECLFDDVIAGIRNAEAELRDFGVRIEIKTMKGFDPESS